MVQSSGVVHRLEVASDVQRRRRWSEAAKAAVVLDSLAEGAVVTEVARRHGVSAQQVHGWRREVRAGRIALPAEDPRTAALTFAPILVEPVAEAAVPPPPPPPATTAFEIDIGAGRILVRNGADPALVAGLVRALRPGP